MKNGLVQVYTGDGKGKTTAAIGQGIRSAGRGLKVVMIQFLKSCDTGELHICNQLGDCFKIVRFEKKRGFFWTLNEKEIAELKTEVNKALEYAQEIMKKEECDVLILDEIMAVIHNNLIDERFICELIQKKPQSIELILTGRDAPKGIVDLADYVSEIIPVKHPMEKGISARKGIEY
ncbi:MAG: cob(I)yrinic acid a,c-diamide adenosyltransferase [Clostridiaceae bacterium]|nr:cob(I)yrinic acid a,c-diamide adenosyltransferase [Clostridiaceae bacterium]